MSKFSYSSKCLINNRFKNFMNIIKKRNPLLQNKINSNETRLQRVSNDVMMSELESIYLLRMLLLS